MRTVFVVLCWLSCCGAGLLTLPGVAQAYTPPKRSVDEVAKAIGFSRPELPLGQRRAWAKALLRVAAQHRFDALSGWALIHHESRWRSDAVSSDGHDVGLGQIRVTLRKGCADPDSAQCQLERQRLFDPATNMAAMATAITAWRTLCKKQTGKAEMRHWLAGYGGYSRPPKTLCGQVKVRSGKGWRWRDLPTPKPVRDIIQLRRRMIQRLRATSIFRPAETSPLDPAVFAAASWVSWSLTPTRRVCPCPPSTSSSSAPSSGTWTSTGTSST